MNEWEQNALNKIIGKLGPDFHGWFFDQHRMNAAGLARRKRG